jgi:hypothetical protein
MLSSLSGWAAGQAKEEPLPVLKTKPKILTVFKNGLGFFIREGATDLKNGWAVTEEVPAAALGSLWVTSLEPGSPVEETVSLIVELEKETPAGSLEALLAANVGKKVVLTANNQAFEGVIKAAPGTIVILATSDREEIVLNKGSVFKVEFRGDHVVNVASKAPAKRMKFKVAGRASKARLMLSYLQKGVTWQPSYLVNIEDPKKARLTMKATLVNDVEDLDGVDAYFVVGYPNFRFADVISPMALDQAIGQFLAELDRAEQKDKILGPMANVMAQRMAPLQEAESLDYGLAGLPGVVGAPEEDLFLYAKKGLVLKKGERAEYPIFSHEVDYKHVYEWKIPDTLNVDYSGFQQSGQRQTEIAEQVWHAVKLINATEFPWTTAPALAVSGWKPLAQEILDYTPRGTSTNLKLTVATDIKVNKREEEADRQRDVRIRNSSYDLVTVKGELDIRNAKAKDVTVEIKKRLTGEVLETSHGGRVTKVAEGLRGVNSNALVAWEIPVKAGEEVKVTYSYKVYIHN